jgi:PEP-CTERM motif
MSLRVFLFCLLIGIVSNSAKAGVIVTDSEFADSDWMTIGVETTGVGRTFIGNVQIAMPGDNGVTRSGNPGAFQWFGQTHGGLRNGTMTIRGIYILDAFEYDPSLGPLQTLNVSYDALRLNENRHGDFASDVLTFGVGVLQNGNFFFAGATTLNPFETWTPLEFNGLTESDFTYSGVSSPVPVLDFSATGAPIKFGYYAFNSSNFTTTGEGGVDNFRLEVNPQGANSVPEPGSSLLALMCLGGVALWRRLGWFTF